MFLFACCSSCSAFAAAWAECPGVSTSAPGPLRKVQGSRGEEYLTGREHIPTHHDSAIASIHMGPLSRGGDSQDLPWTFSSFTSPVVSHLARGSGMEGSGVARDDMGHKHGAPSGRGAKCIEAMIPPGPSPNAANLCGFALGRKAPGMRSCSRRTAGAVM